MNHSTSPSGRSLLDLTVREFLEVLASSAPAPGGGAAAALVGAMGAALIEMTGNLTVGRPKFADVEQEAQRIVSAANETRHFFERAADEDARAFAGVSAAYKLPRERDAEKEARSAAVQTALGIAARAPLGVAGRAAELIDLAQQGVGVLNPAVVSDVMVGALLAYAALEGAGINVEVNLGALKDDALRQPLDQGLAEARTGAQERTRRVVEAGRARMS